MTEALTSNYWISPNAVRITLNAMGRKDYIQCGAAGGAVIMCYIRDVDGLGYDAGHNYRRWPIVTAPVYFNSWTRKYVYIAIPRSTAVGTSAILVFPSKHIDLYGMTEPADGETEGEQIGSKDYYYIFLRGVISPSRSDDDADQLREWEEYVDYGTLSTDQHVSEGDSEWWRYNADDDTVTFLKVITNATFKVLNVLKNLTVGGDGSFGGSLSVAKDAVVGGLLTAVSAVINSIKSTNYSGSSMADTGWSITNDNGSGSSEAVFDYLTVRKKMTINSLEIKETHFTAGDICQSLATAEIVRTDYYYVDPDSGEMEKLGYSKYRVPWLLKGLALVLGKRAQNMKIFSRWKTVRINLTRNELLRCNRVRCYFLAKDGEREIENWWRENDLARCQTWNMTKAQRNTFIPNFNDHAGNIYWWRTVKNTSWNTGLPRYLLTDGDGNPKDPSDLSNTTTDPDNPNIYRNEAGLKYEVTNGTYNNEKGTQSYKDHQPAVIDGKTYHWIDIAFDGSREIDGNGRLIGDRTGWCDANSDIPAAGDKVVQFGNTVDPDRMNLMLWEVNGSGNMDAPDWKMYAGIYTFDLNLCWWGGTPQKTKWSYRTGIRVYAPKFEWITEYGIAKQAFDRGHWTELPLERDDDTRLHEDDLSYYPEYPDDIKNPDGTFKSRKNGEPRNFIRKCHYYDRVSHEGSMWLCSINETNYWVAKETFTTEDHVNYTKGDRISNFSSLSTEDKTHCEQVRNYTFDEPSIASLDWMEVVEKGDDGSFKSRVFCRSNDTPLAPSNEVKTVSGITYNTFNNPVPPPVTGQPHWHDGAPDGTTILWSSTAWFYPNGTHTEWTTPSPETDTADLDIEFSPNYNKPDAPYSGNDFTPDMRGNGTAYGVKDATHSNKRANGSGEDANWYDPTADANNTHADWNDMIWRAERKIKNGEYIGSWSITRIKGEQGDTPVTAYRWYKEEAVATTAPTAPTGESANPTATDHISDGNANPATKWSNVAPNRPATGWCLYMTTSYRFDDGTYGQWTTPIRISGTDGTPGEDAENVEWIYKTSPDTNVTIPTNSPNQKGYVPAGWTNHPTGIDATNIYEFACFRILPEGANVDDTKVWSKWMGILGTGSQGDTPIIWSHWGRNGMDGDGFEYVYVRTTTNSAPTIVVKADSYTDSNGHKFTDDEFLPKALVNGTEIECSDDPQSIDPVNKYVWVAKRTKGPANTDTGVRTWEKYSGTMSLWNNWADNAVRIDLDNQADLISLDAEGKVRFARTIVTRARIYDGGSVATSGVTKASSLTEAKLKFGNRQPSISNVVDGVVTITWAFQKGDTITTNTEPKTISLTYKNETYDAVFSLGTTDRDVIYQVLPNPDKVSFSKSSSNALSPASVSLACDYTKDTGSGTIQTITNVDKSKIDDGNYLYYRVKGSNGSWGSWTAYTGDITVLNSTTDTDYEFAISTAATAASVTDSNIYEREVVPIVKDGLDGKSITKSSADTYKYKVSDDGTTTPSGTWYSTKQAAIDAYNTAHSISGHDWKQGTFMWTETTIHWSNNTETILYTNERNSVDGKAGQDIVNGTTTITYCVKDSNSPQPPDSDFHAYNASEVVQGKWLWSKATTPYYKANDLEHPIGYSSNYTVSYISEDGADGKDGNGIVSITNTYGISASGKTNSDTTAPSDVTTWSAGSPDATTSKPYLWKKEVTVYTDTTKNTTKYYCIGRYGDNGIDAQDVEFVYVRTTHNVAPTIAADTETPQGYKNDDYLPFAKVSSGRIKGGSEANANAAVRCTDDPKGVDNTWKYEWEIKRTKGAAAADGKREWDNYVSGANMTLHNNLAESTLIIDIDNDNDQFGTDSDGRVNSQQTRTTKVTMLYGTEKQAFTSAPTATLKYDDGTPASGNVDITVASVSVTKVTDDNKEYKVTVNISQTPSGTANPPFKTHNGLYVDIEGTCAKGGPKTIRFSLEKVMSGEKGSDAVVYQLAPSQRSFSFGRSNTNEIVAKSNTVIVNLKITQGNNSVIYVSPGSIPSGMTVPTISWGFEDEQTATAEHSNLPVGTAISITPAQLTKGSGLHTKVWIKLSTGDREEIPVVIDGENGQDGDSITKQSETSYYIKNTTGVRPAENDPNWSTTKPTLNKGEWLFTKTDILWSDGSHTILYTDERNPNDGLPGQGIIVDGATVMKYYVGDSNTTHPADGSSDWKDLSQVTQTQGKWLWSQATTYYRKSSSSSGSHDAGSSINYNVSYISKDGKTGRGIQSITEYYQATNNSASRQAPTSESGWDTDPNLSHLTDKWNQIHKYLWNMEKTVYSNVDGTTTTEYSIPQILAIWTKDGDAGRGIDSIVNYYKVTSSATAPSKPSTPGTDGWSTTPQTPSKGQYLWNYEIITWVNGTPATTETSVQMIGYAGTDGTSPYFADIDNEMDSVSLDAGGKTTAAYDKTVNLMLWHGSDAISLTTLSYKVNGGTSYTTEQTVGNIKVTPNASAKTLRVRVASAAALSLTNDIEITVAGTGSGNKTLHFVLNGVKPGANGEPATIFDLRPSISSIKCDKTNTLSPTSFTCSVQKVSGSSVSTATSSDGTLRYRIDADITSSADGTALAIGGTINSYTSNNKYITLAFFDKDGTLRDKERILIVADGTDGAAGRAVISASEHYKVSNNDGSAGHQEAKPIADGQENASLEWGTDPNAAIASWGENARYLWNYEKTGYSSGTTPVRTTPRIIAIWTEDGANGKGIDHITNYYKASAKTGIGTDVESYPTTDAEWAAWDDNPVAPTSQNPYLWNFEVIYWVDPTNTTHTTPHVIGHYGQDAEIVTVYQEAESTPAKPMGSTIPPTGWSLTEPRVGYNATEKMDELRLVNTDTDVHTLSRKYIVINNTSAKVKMGIKLVLGGTVYSNSEGVAVYDGNTKVAEQAGRTGTKDNVSIEIAANAKKVYEVRLTRAGSYSDHTIYGCFAFTGGGMNISPMYVWQSHAVFHGTTISDDGWSDPVTYTARNGDNSDTEKDEYVYIRSKQCDVYPTTDSNSLDINRKYPSEDEYLPWVGNYGSGNPNQFERNYWSDDPSGINNTWPYEFQAHRVKTNGVWGAFGDIKLYQSLGEQGPSGDNAYVVVPENLIVNQNLDGSMPTTDDILFKVKSGGNEWNGTVNTTPAPTATDYLSTLPSGVTATETHSTASVVSGKLRINIGHYSYTYQGKTVTSYYDHVAFALSVTANGVTVSHIFHVYINLLGSFRTTIEGDIEESIATKKFYFKDSNGNIVAHETIGDYIRSSAENTSILTKKVDNGKNLLTGVLTGAAWKSAATVSGTLKNVTMDGYVIMRAEGDSYIVSPNISLTSGTKYTLSFRFETSGSFYIYIKGSSTNISHTASAGSYCSYTFQAPASENVRIYIGLASLYYPQLEIGDTATDFDANTTEVSSRISQTAESIDFTITNKLGETGINIDGNNRKITAKANTFEICNSADTTTFSVDSNGNLVGAGNAKFNGNIEATGGKIGGFDIGQNDLKNTNYGAGITIQNEENNPTKVVKIGNDATDEITGNKCSMIAESKGSNTYNTALYLNAQGATYNYAFHGNGNGVLNGFVQGYKVKAISNIGESTYLSLRDGQTQAIISVSIDGRKNVYLPTLGDCRATLGLKDNDTSDFCCRLTVINQTAIQSTNYNRDNISIVGGTHEYTDQITNIQTRPRLLYTSKDTALEIQSAVSCDLIITYINKRFIASYIKTQW